MARECRRMVVGRQDRMADRTLERMADRTLERMAGRPDKLSDRTLARMEKEGLERLGRSSSLPPTALDRPGQEGASSRVRKVGD